MDPWRKESLNLQVGDFIIWQGEAIELEGQPAMVTPGMKGKVLSLHGGFQPPFLVTGVDDLATHNGEDDLQFRDLILRHTHVVLIQNNKVCQFAYL